MKMLGTKLATMSSKLSAFFFMGLVAAAGSLTAFADQSSTAVQADLGKITNPIVSLLDTVFTVMIPIVAALGAIFCVFLGVKYSKAEEPQEREKAKSHLKAAIIGFVIIFVLVVALKIGTGVMTSWATDTVKEASQAAST